MKSLFIKRRFEFDYGHRIQNHKGKCKNLHGHRGVLLVTFSSPLFEEGMIEDFGVLKEQIGEWIDAYLDHKLILSVRDPLSSLLVRETEIYLINGPPTAENLAITCAERISWLIKEPLQVYEVEFFETPNCSAIYRNPYVSVE